MPTMDPLKQVIITHLDEPKWRSPCFMKQIKSMVDNLNIRKISTNSPKSYSLQTSLFRAIYWVGQKVHSVNEYIVPKKFSVKMKSVLFLIKTE